MGAGMPCECVCADGLEEPDMSQVLEATMTRWGPLPEGSRKFCLIALALRSAYPTFCRLDVLLHCWTVRFCAADAVRSLSWRVIVFENV